ncbi:MAG TPA: protein-L-isoaspartate(D-aspartate) O-methyltransferase [Candidatus Binatia bacterium]|nr:protein-L-isoaspartate(D-aspartate) O-methyltransferase [Candidatus Binatia bacterium]
MPDADLFAAERRAMVEQQLRARGIRDPRVLEAMGAVPRHLFVPPESISLAYSDHPLSIGYGQTISQPFMVAAMAEALEIRGIERVLEVGAGCGYQAAILARMARRVVAIELVPQLAETAARRLGQLGFANLQVLPGDASAGFPQQAPYDGIVVSAAARFVPRAMLEQLAEGGRLLIPVGPGENQELLRYRRAGNQFQREALHECRFVPLLGRHSQQENQAL